MKYPKLREIGEAVKALVTGPYTSPFPKEPHQPYSSFRGQPKFDAGMCLGCLACEQVCPAGAIAHEDRFDAPSGPRRVMIHYTDVCIFCGQCEEACINDHRGIRLTTDWELSFFERGNNFETIEKPLQLCEACGGVVACIDHLRWIADRLGPMSFSSPTLYLTRLDRLGAVNPQLAISSDDGPRANRFKILCARCRRKASMTEEQT